MIKCSSTLETKNYFENLKNKVKKKHVERLEIFGNHVKAYLNKNKHFLETVVIEEFIFDDDKVTIYFDIDEKKAYLDKEDSIETHNKKIDRIFLAFRNFYKEQLAYLNCDVVSKPISDEYRHGLVYFNRYSFKFRAELNFPSFEFIKNQKEKKKLVFIQNDGLEIK